MIAVARNSVCLFIFGILLGCGPTPDDFSLAVTERIIAETKPSSARSIVLEIRQDNFAQIIPSLTSTTRGRPNLATVAKRFAEATGSAYTENRGIASGLILFDIKRLEGLPGRINGGQIRSYEVVASIIRLEGQDGGSEILFRNRVAGQCERSDGPRPACDNSFFENLAARALAL